MAEEQAGTGRMTMIFKIVARDGRSAMASPPSAGANRHLLERASAPVAVVRGPAIVNPHDLVFAGIADGAGDAGAHAAMIALCPPRETPHVVRMPICLHYSTRRTRSADGDQQVR